MSTNSIQVSAVDNELYIIACDWTGSYQLCHILSGNGNQVDVNINILPGTYVEPPTLNGVNNKLNDTYSVSIPSGKYSLIAVGIDWGGGQSVQMSVSADGTVTPYGVPYNPGPFPAGVFWTNNGVPLATITV